MTSSPPPGERDGTRPVWLTPEFWLGATTYSTSLVGSVSEAVRGLTFIPVLAFALFAVLQPRRFRIRPPLLLFCLAFLTWHLASYLLNERTPYGTVKVPFRWSGADRIGTCSAQHADRGARHAVSWAT